MRSRPPRLRKVGHIPLEPPPLPVSLIARNQYVSICPISIPRYSVGLRTPTAISLASKGHVDPPGTADARRAGSRKQEHRCRLYRWQTLADPGSNAALEFELIVLVHSCPYSGCLDLRLSIPSLRNLHHFCQNNSVASEARCALSGPCINMDKP